MKKQKKFSKRENVQLEDLLQIIIYASNAISRNAKESRDCTDERYEEIKEQNKLFESQISSCSDCISKIINPDLF